MWRRLATTGWTPRAAALLLAGCAVSPIPEPPNFHPEEVLGEVCLVCDPLPTEPPPIDLRTEPGTVAGADVLWVASLDRPSPPDLLSVAEDGSFEGRVWGSFRRELRLQARRGELRGDPVDVLVGTGPGEAPLLPLEHPLASCLSLGVGLELDLGVMAIDERRSREVNVANTCGEEVTLTVALRAPSETFRVDSAASVTLADGDSTVITVDVAPPRPGTHEEILLVEATAPSRDLRPITLVVTTPD